MTTTPPAQPSPAPSPTPNSSPGGRRQLLGPRSLALIAVAISVVMTVVAATALGVALDARRQAAEARSQIDSGSALGPPPPSPAADTDDLPVVDETTAPPLDPAQPQETPTPADVLNPQAVYEPWYSGDVLNPQATSDTDAQIDLDEPRVGADFNRTDLVLSASFRSDVPVFALNDDDQAFAEAATPDLTPGDCADLIRTGPLPGDVEVPAQRGTVLCITTSPAQAAAQGINQRIILLKVTALNDEGRVTVELDAWQIPR